MIIAAMKYAGWVILVLNEFSIHLRVYGKTMALAIKKKISAFRFWATMAEKVYWNMLKPTMKVMRNNICD